MDIHPNVTENTWTSGITFLDDLWKINDARVVRLVKLGVQAYFASIRLLRRQGAPGTGKSELLHQLALSCILPKEYGGLRLAGNESIVVFFSNDHKFSLSRIVQLYYQRIIAVASTSFNTQRASSFSGSVHEEPESQLAVESLLSKCLSRLWIIRCKDVLQLRASLAALPRRLATISKRKQQEQLDASIPNASVPEQSVTLIIDSLDTFSLLENKSTYHHEPIEETVRQWLFSTPNSMAFAACSEMSIGSSSAIGTVLSLNGTTAECGDQHRRYQIDPTTGFAFI